MWISRAIRKSMSRPYVEICSIGSSAGLPRIDRAKIYKSNPRCYGLVEEALGVVRGDVLFVSSNSFDVVGAKRFGFKVAWIQRAGGLAPDSYGSGGPGQMYRMLRGRAEELGREPDFCVSTLTELLSLL